MKIEFADSSYVELTYDSQRDIVLLTQASKNYQTNTLIISTVELTKAEYLSLVKSDEMIGLL